MSHHHHHSLNAAFWLTAAFAVVEVVGGFWANSLALLADAAHMVSDVAALGLAMWAQRIAKKPAHDAMTYGYGRVKILAALINGLMLWILSAWIIWEAVHRLAHPPTVQGGVVVWIASIGLLINLIIMRWLHGAHDLNTRAAYLHVLGDAMGSLAAIVAGMVILWTGWLPIDPLLSLLVAVILIWGGWQMVRETTVHLMAATPSEVDVQTVQTTVTSVAGVEGIHHVHLWRLPSGSIAMSAHIHIQNMQQWTQLLPILLEKLHHHHIEHATLQPEIMQPHDVCAPCDTKHSHTHEQHS